VEEEIIEEEKEIEEIIEEPAGGEDDWDKPDIFDDYEEGGTKRKLWLVLLGSLFGLLVLWVLYNWGGYSNDVQVGEFEAGETPAEAVPGEGAGRPEYEEDQAPEVESGTIRGDFLSGISNAPYSLILASYRETSTAARGRDELIRAGFEAYLVPVEIPGQGRWTRLMLGQYIDEATARASLQEVIAGSGFREGRVVASSFAFLLGGFGSIGEAEEVSSDVEKLGLDTYILVSDEEDKVYFLYTGAFEDAGQAGYLADILKGHELEGELVKRRGFHL
jgi:cell division septation protein DedD